MSSLNIAVLSGGISHEREVSLRSGRRVADALTARGHNVTIIDPDASLFATLKNLNPDVVWPALHGSSGEEVCGCHGDVREVALLAEGGNEEGGV